jgi:hypothetical protein
VEKLQGTARAELRVRTVGWLFEVAMSGLENELWALAGPGARGIRSFHNRGN